MNRLLRYFPGPPDAPADGGHRTHRPQVRVGLRDESSEQIQVIRFHLGDRLFLEQISRVFKVTSPPSRLFQFQRQIELGRPIVEVLCWSGCITIKLQAGIGLIGSAKIDLEQR